jgi:hypothetical protein
MLRTNHRITREPFANDREDLRLWSHRRVLVNRRGNWIFRGYGISEAWTGDGRTPEHWRDTNVTNRRSAR